MEVASIYQAVLSTHEEQALVTHEQVIERGLKTFYEVGTALAAIRDERLYRRDYSTFEDYCQERWSMTHRHVNRLIASSEVVTNLGPMGPILPSSERQTRPLAILTPDEQREVWPRIVESAPNGKVTAAHVEQVVSDYRPTPMAVHYSSETPEWYTPRSIIDLVVEFFDDIDLDPCSNSRTDPNVPAKMHFTAADNGLNALWWGRVYMNPPYGDEIEAWINKLVQSYTDGDIEAAIALVPGRIDTAWYRLLRDYTFCHVRGRLKFVGADNSAPFPSVLVYLGDEVDRFAQIAGRIGDVFTRWGADVGARTLIDDDSTHPARAPRGRG